MICDGRYGERIGVRCRQYSLDRRVTLREVCEFITALTLNACNGGILITTSTLTDDALEEVKRHGNIMVIDGHVLRRMLRRLGL